MNTANGCLTLPFIDAKTWTVNVRGDGVSNPFLFNYDDLLAMPATTVIRQIECSADGTPIHGSSSAKQKPVAHRHPAQPKVQEWTGAKLSYIIGKASIKRNATIVTLRSLDGKAFVRTIPIMKAMNDDAILAYLLNGDTIPAESGFPARCIVPGLNGLDSVKRLGMITVSINDIEAENYAARNIHINDDSPSKPASPFCACGYW